MGQVIPFDKLDTSDLFVDAIYEGEHGGQLGGEPISKVLPGVSNMGGFRASGRGERKKLVALFTTGEHNDWPDTLDYNTGQFIYFGDNRTPDTDLHETNAGGNKILRYSFDALHANPAARIDVPPFFVFQKHPTKTSGRSVRFCGLAVPGFAGIPPSSDLTVVTNALDKKVFVNYKAIFTILDVRTIPRAWLEDLANGRVVTDNAPSAYLDWLKNGNYRPLKISASSGELQDKKLSGGFQEDMSEFEHQFDPSNYWIAHEAMPRVEDPRIDKYILRLQGNPSLFSTMKVRDWVIVTRSKDEAAKLGRVLRVRANLYETTIYFDKLAQIVSMSTLESSGIIIPKPGVVSRVQADIFVAVVPKLLGKGLDALPLIEDQTYIRELLQLAVTDDLLGPAGGPHEHIVDMSVRDRYLVGKLAPKKTAKGGIEGLEGSTVSDEEAEPGEEIKAGRHEPGAEFSASSGRIDAEAQASEEVDAISNQSLIPSSFGMTFCVDSDVENISIEAYWGKYERIPADEHDHVKKSKVKIKNAEGRVLRTEERETKARAWCRIPCGGPITLKIVDGPIAPTHPQKDNKSVVVQGMIRPKNAKGERLVTLFLVNDQDEPPENKDSAWLFQPEIIVKAAEPQKAIFKRRPALELDGVDDEREMLEMVYRNHVEFAVGHGISVHAVVSNDSPSRATELRSSSIPSYEVPFTDIPGKAPTDREFLRALEDNKSLDMKTLAAMPKEDLISLLTKLKDDYSLWHGEQLDRIGDDVKGYDDPAKVAMARCDGVLKRLGEGIKVLQNDAKAFMAFRLANEAMALQRVRSLYALSRRRSGVEPVEAFDIPKNRSWRPFQLAFILLSIPSLADPLHGDRTNEVDAVADLLWFPTGGGKTEAYLGVAAFTMFIRRLKADLGGYDGSRGLTVLMRYTLRLLTLQQFQRATTLICAMEDIRRKAIGGGDLALGAVPFTMGLWVGNKVTPGTTKVSREAINRLRNPDQGRPLGASPAQLTSCPWCGAQISAARDIDVQIERQTELGRTLIYCSDSVGRCPFSRAVSSELPHPGVPVLVVDDEIYARPPTMMIATVDKFAMMAWRGNARALFGISTRECTRHGLVLPDTECTGNHPAARGMPRTVAVEIDTIRPPDLIIQDEFHLISGPLGTMVGLYETAIDELCSWKLGEKKVRPKVIASTATVRKAIDQVHNVFLRRVEIFPPNGLEIKDNYFSIQRPVVERAGRKYMGICSPGSSRPAVLIRTYVAFLAAAQSLFDTFGLAADPYMTMVGYFNSLRELGGMKRLAEDDVQTRTFRVAMSLVERPGLAQRNTKEIEELTSRVSSQDIPKKLDSLEVMFKAQYDAALGKFVTKWQDGEARAIDVVLSTNMLSVGVDINRLGVMVVNGQPKGTAEYIQATSRVGRQSPGLVCSVLTWARPRDLSHYETYEHYHATFYKHVEAQSVTPFSPRAMDRGLTGALVSLMRHKNDDLSSNRSARNMRAGDSRARDATELISKRAENVVKVAKPIAETGLKARIDDWANEAQIRERILGYEKDGPETVPLLEIPGLKPWTKWTTPMSMREVESGVRLIMDTGILPEPPRWAAKPVSAEDGEESQNE